MKSGVGQVSDHQTSIAKLVEAVSVIPVLAVDDPAKAVHLAKALVEGGLPVLEVTLRTDAALDVVQAMTQVEGAVVGVGTLMTAEHVRQSVQAGAKFGVSPGSTETVLDACEAARLPLLPGIDSVTTAMSNLERGYLCQKFFPAEQSGGVAKLQALYAPLPQITFCPTGGISPLNASEYLALPNVCCVGGSWVAPTTAVDASNWGEIRSRALEASKLAEPASSNTS